MAGSWESRPTASGPIADGLTRTAALDPLLTVAGVRFAASELKTA